MSAETVIRVEGVGKQYVLGQTRLGTEGLRHALQNVAEAPFRLLKRGGRIASRQLSAASDSRVLGHNEADPRGDIFDALQDITFDVRRGEVVGIVGPNGAGKSTLLKILSRITEPTVGRVGLKGRVASLLEVGTGFHPELTGRENIYLNGSILGMSKSEISSKFDEIVAFAEVERFLNTPVKRYSSGMYVRLAFAVAAHLQPEILLVDEVLAVGDAAFQKRCLGKMGDVAKEGRTDTVHKPQHGRSAGSLRPSDSTAVRKACHTTDRPRKRLSAICIPSCPSRKCRSSSGRIERAMAR